MFESWVRAGRIKLNRIRHGSTIASTTPDLLDLPGSMPDASSTVAAAEGSRTDETKFRDHSVAETDAELIGLPFEPTSSSTTVGFERAALAQLQRADPEFVDIIDAHVVLRQLEVK